MLDVLGAIHGQRGADVGTRPGSDGSVRATAYLLDYDSVTYLSEVSVHGSEPIGGVPTVPSTYTGVTTVYVLMDGGRPVQVLGPASDVAVGGTGGGIEAPPSASTSTTRTVTGLIVGPAGSGTYRVDRAAWDRWNTTSYGGASDAYQAGSSASGTRPAGAPTYTGSTVSVTVPGYGRAGQVVTVDLDSTMRGDLRTGAIKSLGLTGATYGGTYGAGRAPGWYLSLDYTVSG